MCVSLERPEDTHVSSRAPTAVSTRPHLVARVCDASPLMQCRWRYVISPDCFGLDMTVSQFVLVFMRVPV